MLFDEMILKDNCLNLDVKKMCYSNPVKNITMLTTKIKCKKHAYNKSKQVLTTFMKQHLRVFNGTND